MLLFETDKIFKFAATGKSVLALSIQSGQAVRMALAKLESGTIVWENTTLIVTKNITNKVDSNRQTTVYDKFIAQNYI